MTCYCKHCGYTRCTIPQEENRQDRRRLVHCPKCHKEFEYKEREEELHYDEIMKQIQQGKCDLMFSCRCHDCAWHVKPVPCSIKCCRFEPCLYSCLCPKDVDVWSNFSMDGIYMCSHFDDIKSRMGDEENE